MDFTYAIAVLLGAIVGIGLQGVLLVLKQTQRFGLGGTFGLALAVNAAVLINWRELVHAPPPILLADLLLFPVCTFVGVIVGTLPFLIVVGLAAKVGRRLVR